ncbi:E2F transcription factor-like E2FE isoform X2 [Phalaenopsis equestris]|uniref:E2F transcription factor-like E2FE isoform X2 n=1 Tax=Phalaenopsis equestris TaxID=78828 RepID=UPI0009E2FC1A|nr:E2F transcription factor-like E2FE isoform X2 [Phalaenopsis equestris]
MAEKSDSGSRHHAYSRKQKSLGLLCSNFVSLYNKDDVETVCLDDAAMKLGVERRRIYDIVNVMESIGVLTRKAKNRYLWIGLKGIPITLEQLKEGTAKEHNASSLEFSSAKVSDDEEDDKSFDHNDDYGEGRFCTNDTAAKSKCVAERKEKSLGQLTQNFVKLLLSSNAEMVSLDEAAKLLLGDGQNPSYMRTKVRRLYDIANVLSSLNLIEKTHQSDTRKPAFRWLGTKGKCVDGVTVAIPPFAQKSGKRMFGTELTNVDFKRTKLLSSVENKPIKTQVLSHDLKECNKAVERQLQGSKSFVFGPFNPPKTAKEEITDKKEDNISDFESFASSFRPSYHSQALHELFSHYMEAYNSWFAEITGGNNTQQPLKKSVHIGHS